MKRLTTRLFLFAAAVLLCSRPAAAVLPSATITQTVTTPKQTVVAGNGLTQRESTPVFGGNLNRFNPALGTLLDVKLELDSQWSLFGVTTANPGGGGVEVSGFLSWDGIRLGSRFGGGASQFYAPMSTYSLPFDVNHVESPAEGFFVGTGTAALQYPRTSGDPLDATYLVGGAQSNASLGLESLTLTLTYTYAPVPEPASLVALTLGGATLLALARKARRRVD